MIWLAHVICDEEAGEGMITVEADLLSFLDITQRKNIQCEGFLIKAVVSTTKCQQSKIRAVDHVVLLWTACVINSLSVLSAEPHIRAIRKHTADSGKTPKCKSLVPRLMPTEFVCKT